MKPAVFTGHSLDPQVSGERMYTAQVMLQHTPAGPVRKLSIERRNGQDGIPAGCTTIALSGCSSIDLRRHQKMVSHAVPHTGGSAPHAPPHARVEALPPARLEWAPSAPGRLPERRSSALPIDPLPRRSTTSRRAPLRVRGKSAIQIRFPAAA